MDRIEVKFARGRGHVTRESRNRRLRPTVLALEGRTLLSNFTVNSTADDGKAGTLRWAIGQANANNQADTIVFSSLFNTPQTIKLTGGYNPLTLNDSATTTITGPGADLLTISGGGASKVFSIYGSADLSGLTITGGYGDVGGGLSSTGATAMSNCTISGNSAVYDGGGGILNADGTLTLTNCTITGNHAAGSGGGLYNGFSGTMALTNCTISANGAGDRGGGLDNISTDSLTLTNCTVTGNAAFDGGGLADPGSSATLTNTIVAAQASGGDIFGGFSDAGGNLIGGDPLLAPLGEYGGPTPTMPLLPDSPAIGKGASGPEIPTADQRGFARGVSVDIGAFQTQGLASFSVNVTTDGVASGLGQLSLRQAINLADVEPVAPVGFAPSVFGTTPQTITLTDGELMLTDPSGTVIDGPGAGLLTISGNNASRVFYDQGVSAHVSGLTVTGGNAPIGGGLDNDGGLLSLTGCTITGNVASDDGGGLASAGAATTTLDQCTVTANYCASDGGVAGAGGGIADLAGGTLTLSVVTISGNNGPEYGGGVYIQGTASLFDCTVSGNSAAAGGGLENKGTTYLACCTISGNTATSIGLATLLGGGGLDNNGGLSLLNCTISGNSTKYRAGGGLSNRSTLSLVNCTVSGNIGNSLAIGYSGGGLFIGQFYGGAPALLTNTIVVGNSPGDIVGALNPGSANNLVGDGSFMTGISNGSQGNQVGAPGVPINALLAPLGDYGGSTATMALLPGSTAIGSGQFGAGVPNTDQRDQPRSGRVDIGAFQSQGFTFTPVAGSTPQTALVGTAFEYALAVAVTANNPLEPIDGGQVGFAVLPSAGGASAALSADPATIAAGQATATATANAKPGQYSVVATSSLSGLIDFVLTNASLVVTTAQDDLAPDGLTSLREAIAYADELPGPNTITFDPSVLDTTPQTITLTAGELILTDPAGTTIDGPGAGLLTVSGNEAGRVFQVDAQVTALISGLTITGGDGGNFGYGGGLYNKGTLNLTDCIVSGNSAGNGGGGLENKAKLTLTDCTVSGNSAGTSNAIASGGGLDNWGTATLTDCTVSGNSAGGDGGGLDEAGKATLTLTDCTASGNSAYFLGGGLEIEGTATLTDCTVSGNSAGGLGGEPGGGLSNNGGRVTLTNTIVAGNSGGDTGGGRILGSNNLIGGDPLLAPLGDYGGPTATMALLPGSPAIGSGTSAGAPATDQRGQPRTGHVDIGAFQSQGFILKLVGGSTPQSIMVGQPFTHPLAVAVTAVNPIEPVDGGVVTYAAPTTGASAALAAASVVIANGQAAVTATADTTSGAYTVTASVAGVTTPASFALTNTAATLKPVAQPVAAVAGRAFINVVVATFTDSDPNASPSDFLAAIAWGDGITTSSTTVIADGQGRFYVLGTHTYIDAGTYTFSVQVTDNTSASATATSTATVTAHANTEAPSPVLASPRDGFEQFDDLTSLRAAIAYANSHSGPDTIAFDPAVFGKARRTITLKGGPLVLTDPATVTIIGPGANRLTLSGGRRSGVVDIEGGSLALEGLTIAGGRADRGGGILNDGGRLALDHAVLRGNHARVGGGLFNDGRTTLSAVSIEGNRAHVGSGIFNTHAATLLWRRSPAAVRKTAPIHREGANSVNRITPEHETAAQIDFRPRAAHAGRG